MCSVAFIFTSRWHCAAEIIYTTTGAYVRWSIISKVCINISSPLHGNPARVTYQGSWLRILSVLWSVVSKYPELLGKEVCLDTGCLTLKDPNHFITNSSHLWIVVYKIIYCFFSSPGGFIEVCRFKKHWNKYSCSITRQQWDEGSDIIGIMNLFQASWTKTIWITVISQLLVMKPDFSEEYTDDHDVMTQDYTKRHKLCQMLIEKQ